MLSGRLIELIQRNADELAARVIRKIRRNTGMQVLATRADYEHKEWCGLILANLENFLLGGQDAEVSRNYQIAGRERFEEGVPLHEAVLRIQILKNTIAEFLDEHLLPTDSLHMYAAEEVGRGLSRLFDSIVYSVVTGYEQALRAV